MITFKQFHLIKEDPDSVYGIHPITKQKIFLYYEESTAFPFFTLDNFPKYVIYSKRPAVTHIDVVRYIEHKDISRYGISPYDENIHTKIYEFIKSQSGSYDYDNIFNIAGRVWRDDKIISFWNGPKIILNNIKTIETYLKDIGENIEEFIFQFSTSEKLIPYNNLSSKIKQTISQAEIDKRRREHIQSPLLKTKDKVPYRMPLSLPGQPGKKWWAQYSESINK